jgi:Fe-S-cluster containining protein
MEIKVLPDNKDLLNGMDELMGKRLEEQRLAKLRMIYDFIPSIKCDRNCHKCCGAHPWFPVEALNIRKFMFEHEIEERFAKNLLAMCPYITEDGCLIHPVRPILCRLFGVVKQEKHSIADMECPFAPKPEKMLFEEQAHELISEVELL